MKLRLHHVLLVTVGATLLLTNAIILFVGFQQRAADIQRAYHEHFHLTSKVFAYRSFFVIQGGMEKQLHYYLNRLLTDQKYIIMYLRILTEGSYFPLLNLKNNYLIIPCQLGCKEKLELLKTLFLVIRTRVMEFRKW